MAKNRASCAEITNDMHKSSTGKPGEEFYVVDNQNRLILVSNVGMAHPNQATAVLV